MSDLDRAERFGLLLLLGKGLKNQNRSYIFHKEVVSFPKVALQKNFRCLVFMTVFILKMKLNCKGKRNDDS